jgi:hypothetical protein
MNGPGLTSEDLRRQFPSNLVKESKSFETHGVSTQAAENYLRTPDGHRYLDLLIEADEQASIQEIRQRATDQIRSGRELPRLETIDEPLVKIVPRGIPDKSLPYSPFFARQSAFEDAIAQGRSLSDYFGLPVRSEAQVYDIYQIRPNGPTEVFVNTVAPTSELAGRVTKPGGAEQYLVPNRSLYSDAVRIGSIGNDLSLHRELVVGRGLGSPLAALGEAAPDRARTPRIGGAGRALGIAGLALEAYDGAQTYRTTNRLRGEGNDTAAESELIHFGSRSIGGLGGAAVGAGAGGLATSWSGPGMLVGSGVGGVIGVFGGEKFAEWTDNRRIYNQQDRTGNTWTFDPEQPQRGWERDTPIDASNDGIDNARRGGLRASPAMANELNYQATSTSVELILGGSPPQRDPFTQPAGEHDAQSSRPTHWQHDPDSGQWSRRVYGPFVERGMTPYRDEPATPERAAQLDRAAAQIVIDNAGNSPASIAARYEEAYIRNGWARFGPLPEAVRSARTDIDTLVASDENRYQRQADGRWVSDGMLYDSTANGRLQAELEASRSILAERLPAPRQIVTPPPMTAQERLQDVVAGAYLNAGVDASPQRIAAAAAAVHATWAANALDPDTTAASIRPDAAGGYGLDSPIGSMRLEQDGRTYRIAATTSIDEILAEEAAQQRPVREQASVPPASGDAVATLATVSAPVPSGLRRREGEASTGRSEPDTRTSPLLADDPSHPDHDAFNRIHTWVRSTGQWDEHKSRNIAGALYKEQLADPLVQRVDKVTGALGRNGDENVFAVYAPFGDKGPFFHASVDGREAGQQPAQHNLEQAEQLRQQQAQQQHGQQQEQQQAQRNASLAM